MIIVYAKATVPAANKPKVTALAKELVEATRLEPLNQSYNFVQGREDSDLVAFVEFWPSQEALDTHMATEHFTTIIPQIQELIDGDLDITTHEILV